ncbi:hypothetical protein P0100_19210 [Yersinia pestis]|nr:hypothetical protein [Yersinia pestis]
MDNLTPCVEQLDLSSSLLDTHSSVRSRLSLILTDNIIELLAHQKCVELFRNDFFNLLAKKYTEQERKEALGKGFDQKFKFLARHKEITEWERDMALLIHPFRNEAYHLGIAFDDIIFELSWVYHELACNLVLKMKPTFNTIPKIEAAPEGARKHLNNFDDSGLVNWIGVSNSLHASRPDMTRNLSRALRDSAISRLDGINRLIDLIAKDGDTPKSHNEIIRIVQYSHALFEDKPDGYSTPEEIEDYHKRRRILDENWKPFINSNSLTRWRTRADQIVSIKDSVTALTKFINLTQDFSHFEELVRERAISQFAFKQLVAKLAEKNNDGISKEIETME